MAEGEFATTPSGEPIVDVLVQAYTKVSFPNPFQEHAFGEIIEPRTPQGNLVRDRVGAIPFAAYWGELFQTYRDEYNGNPAGFFAQQLLKAAETQEGDELFRTAAIELGDKHAAEVLEAELDIPELDALSLDVPQLSPLAAFLLGKRQELGEGVIRLDGIQDMSDSWMKYLHSLLLQDPEKHDAMLDELAPAYARADTASRDEMELWEGMMGGYGTFDHRTAMSRVIAGTLGAHLPELVVSHLTEPVTGTDCALPAKKVPSTGNALPAVSEG